ncbi:hypothetical protein FGG78_32370 [Thioclava sp. BHET1]|nr:hypothetical protein FGG78_32370 [Thioclava sp. BHET1]
MIAKHLVAAGLIQPKDDNSHLDDRNRKICAELVRARAALPEVPQVGDFVIMPDGTTERCAYGTAHGMQTCFGGSFHVAKSGQAGMSGSLNRPRLNEYFQLTQETKLGRFWFFSHNLPGAGRGVDVSLPCRVYRLAPFTLTEAEARAHPKAKRVAECWGENHRDHLAAIVALMEGRA